ncbi:LANO_0G03158g1_1 [Lachancea nothofagi CBS 11611]|uniref:LANO_0G03158g1_1 n=1 Tax=Lachancea nothofagi CBS 11611 TaxID=1266666 RepID=A0A1G4KFL1_9SACH|nr:LANO_0G03158g1_1 [Lachancea nothofagi CBS 11611]
MSKGVPNVLVLSIDEFTDKLQPKRVRVSRACDVCRARKIRCDGRQPCIHCTVYSHNCTYNPASRASKKSRTASDVSNSKGHTSKIGAKNPSTTPHSNCRDEHHYNRVIQALFPKLGMKMNASVADRLIELIARNKFQGLLNVEAIESEFLSQQAETTPAESDVDPESVMASPDVFALRPVEMKIVLPPLNMAKTLVFKTWKCACVLFRFNHRPSLVSTLESLYETNPEDYTNDQNRALPLIYSILAVGALFMKDDFGQDKDIQDFFHQEGYKYFTAARKLIDITNISDISAIQTIFMMTIFLQCSAKLSTCYSLVGIAMRAALRIGIHKKSSLVSCSLIEAEVKKRLFWTIYKMDVYVNIILGLPVTISEGDIDQELPGNFNDEEITDACINTNSWSPQISSCALSNEHTKLIRITKRIYDEFRSFKKKEPLSSHQRYDQIHLLQSELNDWVLSLPLQLKPHYEFVNQDETKRYRLANYFLNFDYLHATIMLYRPFIDCVVLHPDILLHKTEELASAIKCLETAQQIIYAAGKMCRQKILCGSYWFSVHTIFLGVTCLMYTVHRVRLNGQSALSEKMLQDVEKDLKKGINLLLDLKTCSVTSERTFNVLTKLFERFDDRKMESSVDEFHRLHITKHTQLGKNLEKSLDIQPPSATLKWNMQNLDNFVGDNANNSHNIQAATNPLFEGEIHSTQIASDSQFLPLAPFFEDSYLTGMLDDWDTLLSPKPCSE